MLSRRNRLFRPRRLHAILAECLHRASTGILPDDLYIELEPWPRIGRSPKCDITTWTVTDDWPDRVPITDAELDMFEARFGDLFDELFGPRR